MHGLVSVLEFELICVGWALGPTILVQSRSNLEFKIGEVFNCPSPGQGHLKPSPGQGHLKTGSQPLDSVTITTIEPGRLSTQKSIHFDKRPQGRCATLLCYWPKSQRLTNFQIIRKRLQIFINIGTCSCVFWVCLIRAMIEAVDAIGYKNRVAMCTNSKLSVGSYTLKTSAQN